MSGSNKKKKRIIRWDRVFALLCLLFGMIYSLTNFIICVIADTNEYRVNYIKELDRKINWWLIDEEDIIKPILVVEEPQYELISIGTFKVTGYCDCVECQEGWVGTTAMGIPPRVNHTVAVDTKLIPLGTRLLINGKEYVAEDVGGAIKGKRIDIFMGSHEETFSSECNGYFDVYIIVE